jgi:hypothetical protein
LPEKKYIKKLKITAKKSAEIKSKPKAVAENKTTKVIIVSNNVVFTKFITLL